MLGRRNTSLATCAICAADIPDGQAIREPLGRGDALVDVCQACATEPPITREPTRQYTGGEGSALSAREMSVAAVKAEGGPESYAAGVKRCRRQGNWISPALTQAERDLAQFEHDRIRRIFKIRDGR